MFKLGEREIQELFALAEEAKKQKKSLTETFKIIAAKYDLAPGSVRNLYYAELKKGNGGSLSAKKVEPFSKEEQTQMLKKVLRERKYTSSMREAFLRVAKGDKKLATRYQNKYCNLLKTERSLVMREILMQKKIWGSCYNPYISKEQQIKRKKLKKEIDELVKIISEKCSDENRLLKKKITLYQKLTSEYFNDERLDKTKNSTEYFVKELDKKIKEKAT